MLQVTSKTFTKRRLELEVSYGKKIEGGTSESISKELCEHFKATKDAEIQLDFKLNTCAICENDWDTGDFAKEKLLLIPKAGDQPVAGMKHVPIRITIPRVVCLSCSQTLSTEDEATRENSGKSCTLSEAWAGVLENTMQEQKEVKVVPSEQPRPQPSHNSYKGMRVSFPSNGVARYPAVRSVPARKQQVGESIEQQKQGGSGSVTPTGFENQPGTGASMVSKNGFLVCTQLVKTGAGDRAGLQVGDIFVQFGQMCKENFKGLKTLANFVRASGNQSIEAVVLRQMNEGNQRSKRGATFKKIRLYLTPLNSHDADDGGVLGAVMNIWPPPKSAAKA